MKKPFKTIILVGLFAPLSFVFNSCEYFVDVSFDIATTPQDSLVIQRWGRDFDGKYDTIPFTSLSGASFFRQTIAMASNAGGPQTTISEEVSFKRLSTELDSIRIIRKSDNSSTTTYRHDENATEAQRYFFTRDAWDCDPPEEELLTRRYTLILTDDMFH